MKLNEYQVRKEICKLVVQQNGDALEYVKIID